MERTTPVRTDELTLVNLNGGLNKRLVKLEKKATAEDVYYLKLFKKKKSCSELDVMISSANFCGVESGSLVTAQSNYSFLHRVLARVNPTSKLYLCVILHGKTISFQAEVPRPNDSKKVKQWKENECNKLNEWKACFKEKMNIKGKWSIFYGNPKELGYLHINTFSLSFTRMNQTEPPQCLERWLLSRVISCDWKPRSNNLKFTLLNGDVVHMKTQRLHDAEIIGNIVKELLQKNAPKPPSIPAKLSSRDLKLDIPVPSPVCHPSPPRTPLGSHLQSHHHLHVPSSQSCTPVPASEPLTPISEKCQKLLKQHRRPESFWLSESEENLSAVIVPEKRESSCSQDSAVVEDASLDGSYLALNISASLSTQDIYLETFGTEQCKNSLKEREEDLFAEKVTFPYHPVLIQKDSGNGSFHGHKSAKLVDMRFVNKSFKKKRSLKRSKSDIECHTRRDSQRLSKDYTYVQDPLISSKKGCEYGSVIQARKSKRIRENNTIYVNASQLEKLRDSKLLDRTPSMIEKIYGIHRNEENPTIVEEEVYYTPMIAFMDMVRTSEMDEITNLLCISHRGRSVIGWKLQSTRKNLYGLEDDWKTLASQLGMSMEFTTLLEGYLITLPVGLPPYGRPTGGELILKYWEYLHCMGVTQAGIVSCSRENLKVALESMDRVDIVENMDAMSIYKK